MVGRSGIRTHGRFHPSPIFKIGALSQLGHPTIYGASNGTRTRATTLAMSYTNQLYYTCIKINVPTLPILQVGLSFLSVPFYTVSYYRSTNRRLCYFDLSYFYTTHLFNGNRVRTQTRSRTTLYPLTSIGRCSRFHG